MANLLNVVEGVKPENPKALRPKVKDAWEKAVQEKAHADWLERQDFADGSEVGSFVTNIVKERDKALDDLVWNEFQETDMLPTPMLDVAKPVLQKLANTPRGQLGDLLDVTQKLGFIIVPWEYLNRKSFEAEEPAMQGAIKEFGTLDDKLDVYVICPPTYYSLGRHLKAKDPNKQIYAGKNSQAFMALKMTIPTLRTMQTQIKILEDNAKEARKEREQLRSAVQRLAKSQEMMGVQLREMQSSVQQQLNEMQETIRQQIEANVRSAVDRAMGIQRSGRASKAQRAEAQSILKALGKSPNLKDSKKALAALQNLSFDVLEPLMFAVPKGTSLQGPPNTPVFIGPCWGPDFEDIIAVASGLKVDQKKRESLEIELAQWQPERFQPRRSDESRADHWRRINEGADCGRWICDYHRIRLMHPQFFEMLSRKERKRFVETGACPTDTPDGAVVENNRWRW